MYPIAPEAKTQSAMRTFVRNRYFYGKLLDVFHFELEQDYLNGKRWLLNRLIQGYGVVCGLDVQPAAKGRGVTVTSGVALDRAGREIVVPRASDVVTVPPKPADQKGQPSPAGKDAKTAADASSPGTPERPPDHRKHGDCEQDDYMHLVICFHQCESDPSPVMVDECGDTVSCAASAVQERYKLAIRDCKAPERDLHSTVPGFLLNGRLNRYALIEHVTRGCRELPADLCIPLANIRLPNGEDPVQLSDIDIAARPIVLSNDLLFNIILALAGEPYGRNRAERL